MEIKNDAILLEIYNKNGASLRALAAMIGVTHMAVKTRLHYLAGLGLIQYVPNVHRGQSITESGKRYLRENGYIPKDT